MLPMLNFRSNQSQTRLSLPAFAVTSVLNLLILVITSLKAPHCAVLFGIKVQTVWSGKIG